MCEILSKQSSRIYISDLCLNSFAQGCSLGLERLGFETASRRFFELLGLVLVSASYVSFT